MRAIVVVAVLLAVGAAAAPNTGRAYPPALPRMPPMPNLVQTTEQVRDGNNDPSLAAGAPVNEAGAAPADGGVADDIAGERVNNNDAAATAGGQGEGEGANYNSPAVKAAVGAPRAEPIGHPFVFQDDPDFQEQKTLDQALQAVKEDIVAKSRQVQDEKKWVQEVTRIAEAYNKKIAEVNMHIKMLQKEVKELFKKKKQIENLRLQKQLQSKITNAAKDQEKLTHATQNVQYKLMQFRDTSHQIHKTLEGLNEQLARLKGENPSPANQPLATNTVLAMANAEA